MMKNSVFFYIIFLALGLSSCYDDLGNYEYNDSVNDVSVELNRVYVAKKEDATFVIRPVIKQTHRADNANLRYNWTVQSNATNISPGQSYGTGDTLAMVIDTKDKNFKYNYNIRFYITDTITGAKQMFPAVLNIILPYEGSWMVLHAQDGMTKLGAVEYIGSDMVSTDDVYFKERGVRLQGEPVSLAVMKKYTTWGYESMCVFYCFTTDPEETGVLRQDDGFKLLNGNNLTSMIYPADYDDFTPSNVRMAGQMGGGVAITGGRVFQGSYYGPRMYEMFPAGDVQGDYYMTHSASGVNFTLLYDAIGHRFLKAYTENNQFPGWIFPSGESKATFQLIPNQPLNAADPNHIGEDKEMVYMGQGYWYGPSMIAPHRRYSLYAFAKSKSTDKSYVYEFHAYPVVQPGIGDDPTPLPGLFTINTPTGVTAETPMTSSYAYNRILFYAVENRIYRLDFGAANGISTLIYEHPGAVKASVMTMAREGNFGVSGAELIYQDYGHPVSRSLGIAFEMVDGTGELVVLNLSNVGKPDSNGKYPAIQKHQGFGEIKDIKFI